MPNYELKKIDVWSLVKITFILSFFVGLIFGIFYTFFMMFVARFAEALSGQFQPGLIEMGGAMGIFMTFFIAVFTSIFYTIISAILAVLYNWISGITGGIMVKLAAEEVPQEN